MGMVIALLSFSVTMVLSPTLPPSNFSAGSVTSSVTDTVAVSQFDGPGLLTSAQSTVLLSRSSTL